MKTYTNTSFTGHWPVGTAAVVQANDAVEAAAILSAELSRIGLGQPVEASDMVLLSRKDRVVILRDGDY